MVQKLRPGKGASCTIAVTGGFGSGKSTVARMLAEEGARVFDADRFAHEALEKKSPVFAPLAALFPEAASQAAGLDRKKIAEIVFRDAGKRKKLEALIHPYVFGRMREEIGRLAGAVIAVEVPLLFETGSEKIFDYVLAVTAPEKVVAERLARKGFSPEEVRLRSEAQWPSGEKAKKADFVIVNNGTINETKRGVEQFWKTILASMKEKGE